MANKKWIDFNINHLVRAKLTAHGMIMLMEYWAQSSREQFPEDLSMGNVPKSQWPDDAGWSRFQMHEFMNIFGEHLTGAFKLPMSTTIQIEVDHDV